MMLAATLLGGALSLFTACVKEDNTSSPTTDPSTDWEKTDQLQVKVTADVPTAVLSSFDAKSMGGALVRRLPKTTSSLDAGTKMVLIKGEDILNRPITEWFEVAKIYLRGGYIAVENRPTVSLPMLSMPRLSASRRALPTSKLSLATVLLATNSSPLPRW